jgi:hypothetical protein
MHPNTAAAIAEGRRRALERRRQLKAAGKADRVWGGSRRARHLPPLSRNPTIRKAQRIVERALAKTSGTGTGISEVPSGQVPDSVRPWESMSKAEKLSKAADLALDAARQILELGVDPSDPRLLQIVKDTALSVIAQQVRVDTAVLSVTAGKRRLDEMSDEELEAIASAAAVPASGEGH